MSSRGPQVAHDRPDAAGAQQTAQVLRFRPRARPGEPPSPPPESAPDDEPFDHLAKYQEEQDDSDNYRHRMLMNVIAVVVVSLLVGVGVWIADTIAEMEKDQDCIMQGRQNCAPIEVPTLRNRQ